MLTSRQLKTLRASEPEDGNRLRVAMRMAGLTQVQLAAQIGITQSYVSRILNGHTRGLEVETARGFALLFGCAIEDLWPAAEEALAS